MGLPKKTTLLEGSSYSIILFLFATIFLFIQFNDTFAQEFFDPFSLLEDAENAGLLEPNTIEQQASYFTWLPSSMVEGSQYIAMASIVDGYAARDISITVQSSPDYLSLPLGSSYMIEKGRSSVLFPIEPIQPGVGSLNIVFDDGTVSRASTQIYSSESEPAALKIITVGTFIGAESAILQTLQGGATTTSSGSHTTSAAAESSASTGTATYPPNTQLINILQAVDNTGAPAPLDQDLTFTLIPSSGIRLASNTVTIKEGQSTAPFEFRVAGTGTISAVSDILQPAVQRYDVRHGDIIVRLATGLDPMPPGSMTHWFVWLERNGLPYTPPNTVYGVLQTTDINTARFTESLPTHRTDDSFKFSISPETGIATGALYSGFDILSLITTKNSNEKYKGVLFGGRTATISASITSEGYGGDFTDVHVGVFELEGGASSSDDSGDGPNLVRGTFDIGLPAHLLVSNENEGDDESEVELEVGGPSVKINAACVNSDYYTQPSGGSGSPTQTAEQKDAQQACIRAEAEFQCSAGDDDGCMRETLARLSAEVRAAMNSGEIEQEEESNDDCNIIENIAHAVRKGSSGVHTSSVSNFDGLSSIGKLIDLGYTHVSTSVYPPITDDYAFGVSSMYIIIDIYDKAQQGKYDKIECKKYSDYRDVDLIIPSAPSGSRDMSIISRPSGLTHENRILVGGDTRDFNSYGNVGSPTKSGNAGGHGGSLWIPHGMGSSALTTGYALRDAGGSFLIDARDAPPDTIYTIVSTIGGLPSSAGLAVSYDTQPSLHITPIPVILGQCQPVALVSIVEPSSDILSSSSSSTPSASASPPSSSTPTEGLSEEAIQDIISAALEGASDIIDIAPDRHDEYGQDLRESVYGYGSNPTFSSDSASHLPVVDITSDYGSGIKADIHASPGLLVSSDPFCGDLDEKRHASSITKALDFMDSKINYNILTINEAANAMRVELESENDPAKLQQLSTVYGPVLRLIESDSMNGAVAADIVVVGADDDDVNDNDNMASSTKSIRTIGDILSQKTPQIHLSGGSSLLYGIPQSSLTGISASAAKYGLHSHNEVISSSLEVFESGSGIIVDMPNKVRKSEPFPVVVHTISTGLAEVGIATTASDDFSETVGTPVRHIYGDIQGLQPTLDTAGQQYVPPTLQGMLYTLDENTNGQLREIRATHEHALTTGQVSTFDVSMSLDISVAGSTTHRVGEPVEVSVQNIDVPADIVQYEITSSSMPYVEISKGIWHVTPEHTGAGHTVQVTAYAPNFPPASDSITFSADDKVPITIQVMYSDSVIDIPIEVNGRFIQDISDVGEVSTDLEVSLEGGDVVVDETVEDPYTGYMTGRGFGQLLLGVPDSIQHTDGFGYRLLGIYHDGIPLEGAAVNITSGASNNIIVEYGRFISITAIDSTGSGVYEFGDSVTLIPDTTFIEPIVPVLIEQSFSRWDDGSYSNPRVVTADGDKVYTALFEPDYTMFMILAVAGVGAAAAIGLFKSSTNISYYMQNRRADSAARAEERERIREEKRAEKERKREEKREAKERKAEAKREAKENKQNNTQQKKSRFGGFGKKKNKEIVEARRRPADNIQAAEAEPVYQQQQQQQPPPPPPQAQAQQEQYRQNYSDIQPPPPPTNQPPPPQAQQAPHTTSTPPPPSHIQPSMQQKPSISNTSTNTTNTNAQGMRPRGPDIGRENVSQISSQVPPTSTQSRRPSPTVQPHEGASGVHVNPPPVSLDVNRVSNEQPQPEEIVDDTDYGSGPSEYDMYYDENNNDDEKTSTKAHETTSPNNVEQQQSKKPKKSMFGGFGKKKKDSIQSLEDKSKKKSMFGGLSVGGFGKKKKNKQGGG